MSTAAHDRVFSDLGPLYHDCAGYDSLVGKNVGHIRLAWGQARIPSIPTNRLYRCTELASVMITDYRYVCNLDKD